MVRRNRVLDATAITQWFDHPTEPLVIAGPCSAESEDQVLHTARALAQSPHIGVFRAGIWKPRTRPGSFEGVGENGLIWLQRVREETGLLTTTEVATPKHIEMALASGIDMLWIGARTSANPFSMQEIANSLRGVKIPVMVKNPVCPDVSLWIGALERIERAGINHLAAIHRGFASSGSSRYRNDPLWQLPVELSRRMKHIPIICDPSHMAGKREFIAELSGMALRRRMSGLMIESHECPERALSDSSQQLTPMALIRILDDLLIPRQIIDASADAGEIELARLREEIDIIDAELLDIIFRRTEVSRRIGEQKTHCNLEPLQMPRWQQVLTDRLNQADKRGLDSSIIEKIYRILHDYSVLVQSKPARAATERARQ